MEEHNRTGKFESTFRGGKLRISIKLELENSENANLTFHLTFDSEFINSFITTQCFVKKFR